MSEQPRCIPEWALVAVERAKNAHKGTQQSSAFLRDARRDVIYLSYALNIAMRELDILIGSDVSTEYKDRIINALNEIERMGA